MRPKLRGGGGIPRRNVSLGTASEQQVPRSAFSALGMTKVGGRLRAPDALQGIERGIHYRLLVFLGSVLIDGGRGLRTEVAVLGVVLQCAHAVLAAGAGESHAALDAIDSVMFHSS
jgi:hypothetical protein